VHVSGEVLGGGDDDALVGEKEAPVEEDLGDDEEDGQVPEGGARVEVDGVVGEEDDEEDVEGGREGLEEEVGEGAVARGAEESRVAAGGGRGVAEAPHLASVLTFVNCHWGGDIDKYPSCLWEES
jgi:hypothetical protein